MDEPLVSQPSPRINDGDYLGVRDEMNDGTTRSECIDGAAAGCAPCPRARGKAEKGQVMKEVPSNASVADDTGTSSDGRYLSHRSGPFGPTKAKRTKSPFMRIGAPFILHRISRLAGRGGSRFVAYPRITYVIRVHYGFVFSGSNS